MAGPDAAHRGGGRSRAGRGRHRPPDRHGVPPLRGGPRLRRLLLQRRPGPPGRVPAGGRVGDAAPRARRRPPDVRLSPHQRQRLLRRRGPPGAADPGGQAGERSPAGPVRPRPGPGLVQPRAVRRAHRQRPARPAGGLVPAGGGAEQRQPHPHRSDRHPARGRPLGLRVRVPDDVGPARLRPLRHEQLRPEVRRAVRRVQRVHVPPAPRCRQPSPLRDPGAHPGGPLGHRPRRTGQLHRHLHRAPGGRVVDPHRPGRPGRRHRLGPGAGSPGRPGGRRLPRPRRARRHPPPAVHPHHGPHAGGRPRRSGRGGAAGGVAVLLRPRGRGEARRPDAGVRLRRAALDRRCGGGGRGGARAGRLAGCPCLSAGLAARRRPGRAVVAGRRLPDRVRRPPERPHRDPQRPGARTRPHRRAGQLGPRRCGPGGGGALRHRRVRGEPDPPDQHTRAVRPGVRRVVLGQRHGFGGAERSAARRPGATRRGGHHGGCRRAT